MIVLLIMGAVTRTGLTDEGRVHATAGITGFSELKTAMESPGKDVIRLSKDIQMSAPVYVKGEKTLEGDGHTLRRDCSGKRVYGGSLLVVRDAKLTIQETNISGGGDDLKQKNQIIGRLIDVKQGKVVLGKKTVLSNNENGSGNSDGGGAVLVQKEGTLLMNEGIISQNQNVVGGAGVRVESGGCFIMNGGRISGNCTTGIGAVEGFDGRGGAIYNQGRVMISGGSLCDNQAKGYMEDGMSYGGVGGMLYNQGECQIQGGTITGNRASLGGGAIYADKTSKLQITGGTIRSNDAGRGKNLYLAGGEYKLDERLRVSFVYQTGSKKQDKPQEKKRQEKESRKKVKPSPRRTDSFIKSRTKKKSKAGKKTKKSKKEELVIYTAPRYLFVWEVQSYTEEKWKEELLESCGIEGGGKDKNKVNLRWKWGGLLSNRPGKYQIQVSAEKGKWVSFPVTLVEEKESGEKSRYIRFTATEKAEEKIVEIWHFEPEDMRAAKKYMKEQGNPFSSAANQGFLNKFQNCRAGKEGGRK